MEAQLVRGRESLKVKVPDIKKTHEIVNLLKDKHAEEDAERKLMETNFLISDNIWARAKIPNDTGKVGLWLGANVMVQYDFDEAQKLLERNMENADIRLQQTEDDLNFLKDQITTTEVNIARIYNQGIATKAKTDGTKPDNSK